MSITQCGKTTRGPALKAGPRVIEPMHKDFPPTGSPIRQPGLASRQVSFTIERCFGPLRNQCCKSDSTWDDQLFTCRPESGRSRDPTRGWSSRRSSNVERCRASLPDSPYGQPNPASGMSGGHFTRCLATHAGVRLRTEHLGTGQPATEKEEFGRRKFKDQQTDGEHGLGAATCYFGFSSARRRTWS